MPRELEGRRIAVFAGAEGDRLRASLEDAGALVELLSDGQSRSEAEWHGGRYAALVVGSGRDDDLEERVVQLVREFLLSGKPVAVTGDGLQLLERSGGAREDALVIPGDARAESGRALVSVLEQRLEEDRVDEMSDMSFPASDPPSTTPQSIGPKAPRDTNRSHDADAR